MWTIYADAFIDRLTHELIIIARFINLLLHMYNVITNIQSLQTLVAINQTSLIQNSSYKSGFFHLTDIFNNWEKSQRLLRVFGILANYFTLPPFRNFFYPDKNCSESHRTGRLIEVARLLGIRRKYRRCIEWRKITTAPNFHPSITLRSRNSCCSLQYHGTKTHGVHRGKNLDRFTPQCAPYRSTEVIRYHIEHEWLSPDGRATKTYNIDFRI